MKKKSLKINYIYQGHNLETIKKFPSKIIHCIVTSPPYFNQRHYKTEPQNFGGDPLCNHEWNNFTRKGISGGKNSSKLKRKNEDNFQIVKNQIQGFCTKCGCWKGEEGREPTIDMYINNLCNLFDECKRILTDDGSLWVNIGDGYNNSNIFSKNNDKWKMKHGDQKLPLKSMLLVPERFVIEMVNRGWILRNNINWHKINPMPSSITSRMTPDYEKVFWFVKSNKPLYWVNTKTLTIVSKKPKNRIEGEDWDWDFCPSCKKNGFAIITCNQCHGKGHTKGKKCSQCKGKKIIQEECHRCHGKGIVKKLHWIVYNYYYEQLREKLKKSKGKSQSAINKKDGYGNSTYSGFRYDAEDYDGKNMRTTWTFAYEPIKANHFAPFPTEIVKRPLKSTCPEKVCKKCGIPQIKVYLKELHNNKIKRIFKGYASCTCNVKFRKGIIFDPFMGSGTVGIIAFQKGRYFIGTELNPEYVKIANDRLKPYRGKKLITDF